MRHPSIGPILARVRLAPHSGRLIPRLGVVFTLMILLIFAALRPSQCQSRPESTITVLIYNYAQVSKATLVAAEREANRILEIAGARVDWVECQTPLPEVDPKDLCRRGWSAQTPGLRLIAGSNKRQQAEFASTAIPVLITIYYEHVAQRAHREDADANLPLFLGCIVAHELGHILLANPVHSATGIMQPEWGHLQFQQAVTGKLIFTEQQATHIRAQAHLLASLRSSGDPALVPSSP